MTILNGFKLPLMNICDVSYISAYISVTLTYGTCVHIVLFRWWCVAFQRDVEPVGPGTSPPVGCDTVTGDTQFWLCLLSAASLIDYFNQSSIHLLSNHSVCLEGCPELLSRMWISYCQVAWLLSIQLKYYEMYTIEISLIDSLVMLWVLDLPFWVKL